MRTGDDDGGGLTFQQQGIDQLVQALGHYDNEFVMTTKPLAEGYGKPIPLLAVSEYVQPRSSQLYFVANHLWWFYKFCTA